MMRMEAVVASLSQDRKVKTESAEVILSSLYEQYYDKIVRYIFVRINDRSEAENLGGDVFLRALESLDSFKGGAEQMRGWLFKIAHNLVIDHVRKISKRRIISIDKVEIVDKLDVEEAVETNLQVEQLSKALRYLTPAQREVIGLRFFAGLSSDEAGKILGKNSGAIREMQRAAVESLRKQMHF
jgi:RNA polymerase sigma-70 factor (ECF subfamily)